MSMRLRNIERSSPMVVADSRSASLAHESRPSSAIAPMASIATTPNTRPMIPPMMPCLTRLWCAAIRILSTGVVKQEGGYATP